MVGFCANMILFIKYVYILRLFFFFYKNVLIFIVFSG